MMVGSCWQKTMNTKPRCWQQHADKKGQARGWTASVGKMSKQVWNAKTTEFQMTSCSLSQPKIQHLPSGGVTWSGMEISRIHVQHRGALQVPFLRAWFIAGIKPGLSYHFNEGLSVLGLIGCVLLHVYLSFNFRKRRREGALESVCKRWRDHWIWGRGFRGSGSRV